MSFFRLSELSSEQAQTLSWIGMGLFVFSVVSFVFLVGTEQKKGLVRSGVRAGLCTALAMGIISGILYLWHHYFRT